MPFIEIALQRCEGWNECRMPPLGDPCGLPWSLAALRGREPGRLRTVIGSARPVRRFDALRVVLFRASPRPKPGVGPPCAFLLLRRRVIAAPHRSVAPRTRGSAVDSSRNAASPGLSCPTTRSRTGGPAFVGSGSLHHRVPRARFEYLLRGVHHRSSRRARRRSVHGLRTSRRSPRARAALLSEPLPS
jgi:hypothetical protein